MFSSPYCRNLRFRLLSSSVSPNSNMIDAQIELLSSTVLFSDSGLGGTEVECRPTESFISLTPTAMRFMASKKLVKYSYFSLSSPPASLILPCQFSPTISTLPSTPSPFPFTPSLSKTSPFNSFSNGDTFASGAQYSHRHYQLVLFGTYFTLSRARFNNLTSL